MVNIDKFLRRHSNNSDSKVKDLLADAMIESSSITSSPQLGFDRSFYNISGISDIDSVESEWTRIDGSPRKPVAPVNLSALLERTILTSNDASNVNDGASGSASDKVTDGAASSSNADGDRAVAATAAADPANNSNDSTSVTSDDFVLVDADRVENNNDDNN